MSLSSKTILTHGIMHECITVVEYSEDIYSTVSQCIDVHLSGPCDYSLEDTVVPGTRGCVTSGADTALPGLWYEYETSGECQVENSHGDDNTDAGELTVNVLGAQWGCLGCTKGMDLYGDDNMVNGKFTGIHEWGRLTVQVLGALKVTKTGGNRR
ncbi:hypothetical protein EDD16DRAFT_1723217 [Pisolithus croceorrhizus]|nr:hypothetical protein EDD16DRAFT_1723217 [Pisolithus croceorrhizus]KAI6131296.1 hypothetical protein EV401DRAFT_1883999 [Pisolithus croceorrhizus]